jgi:pimeloyl-ACP methyl ester carboxylesterase
LVGAQFAQVATEVQAVTIAGSGHWLLEEQPGQTMDALLQFIRS